MDRMLPAASFDAAHPFLRAPFPPQMVRARILSAPTSLDAPCLVAVYVTSETVIERLNLVCGEHWRKDLHTIAEQTENIDGRTVHSLTVEAHLTVFERTMADQGSDTGEDRCLAEFAAAAQAFKRSARLFGIGHCLYAMRGVHMWRGQRDDQLRYPDGTPEQPYLDDRSEEYVQHCYQQWLAQAGITMYGKPLDHAWAIAALPGAGTARVEGTMDAPARGEPHTHIQNAERRAEDRGLNVASAHLSEGLGRRLKALTADMPFRAEGRRSAAAVEEEWVIMIGQLELAEREALLAVDLSLQRAEDLAGARTLFTRWLSGRRRAQVSAATRKAAAEMTSGLQPAAASQASDTSRAEASTACATGRPSERSASVAIESQESRKPVGCVQAFAALNASMRRHDYPGSVVRELAAMMLQQTPPQAVSWSRLTSSQIIALADLLDCAGRIQWTSPQLQSEIRAIQQDTRYCTSAGRFSALAATLAGQADSLRR